MSRSGSLPSSPLSNDTLYTPLPLPSFLTPSTRVLRHGFHRRHNRNLIPASIARETKRTKAKRLFIKPLISLDAHIFPPPPTFFSAPDTLPLSRVSLYASSSSSSSLFIPRWTRMLCSEQKQPSRISNVKAALVAGEVPGEIR